MTTGYHSPNARFADVTDEGLDRIVREFDEWNETGIVQDGAMLRRLSAKFGSDSAISMMTTATLAFREIIARRGLA